MRRIARARGMTAIEMLTVIAVIGVLLSLLLPAVQAAREAARQAHCKNNLKQLGLAIQMYQGSWNVFPPSPLSWSVQVGRRKHYVSAILSTHTLVLPFLDNASLFNALNVTDYEKAPNNLSSLAAPSPNHTVATTIISTFLCPSDFLSHAAPYAPTNYRTNEGSCGACRPVNRDGAFDRRGTRPSEFTDGLSTTISLSEKPIGGQSPYRYEPMRDWILSTLSDTTSPSPADAWYQHCAGLSYAASQGSARYDGGHSWLLGLIEYTGFTTTAPPNCVIPDCGEETFLGIGVFNARSYHSQRVHAAMADGSVQSISNGVNLQVWRALGTRAKGESISAGSY